MTPHLSLGHVCCLTLDPPGCPELVHPPTDQGSSARLSTLRRTMRLFLPRLARHWKVCVP